MLAQVQPVEPCALPDVEPLQLVTLGCPDAAERELEHEWQARDYRRAQRATRRLGVRRTRQCPRCRLFTVRAHCQQCGFVDTGAAA